jgi:4-amino-4-deoxy-L-arabinose transferase-like glycosyltransferase
MLSSPRRLELAFLFIIVLVGAGLRLLWIQAPLVDAHRWRQADTAGIARSLYEDRFDPFHPQVNWGGRRGYVESEFPLLPALAAGLYHLFGEQEYLGRMVVMVFSTVMIVAIFGVGLELLGVGGGLAAAALVAISPAAVFFGRTFMPDSVMLCFGVSGLWAFLRYFSTRRRRYLVWGSGLMALACLVKLPAVLLFAPIAAAAWGRRQELRRDRALLVALAVPLLVATAWYVHAFFLYRETGLTFGILVHPARTYPPSIAPGPWETSFSKWSNLRVLTSSNYYMTLLFRLYYLLLTPWGMAGALLGLVLWKPGFERLIADAWLLAIVAFVFVMGEANIGHEYYQLPIVPVGALYLGAVIGPVFDRRALLPGWLESVRMAALAVVLLAVGGTTFYYSGIINSHFRPNALDVRVLQAGEAVQRAVPRDALAIVADDYGVTSPLLLHFSRRKGWSFDVANLSPEVIQGRWGSGGKYFVTTVWSRIQSQKPEVAAYLQGFRTIDLQGDVADMVIFDLSRRNDQPKEKGT